MEEKGISAAAILAALEDLVGRISVETLAECGSTNAWLKERAALLPAWHAVVAGRQSAGRGRMGRRFFSPGDTGLYMSVLLRPAFAPEDAPLITPAAAVAVCRALEDLGAERAEIKWVNDVLIGGRKVCGILTESAFDAAGGLAWTVLGIGVNVSPPAGGFPPELADIAGAAFPADRPGLREALAAAILRRLYVLCEALPAVPFAAEYRRRSCLLGRQVTVHRDGGSRQALAVDTDGRCRLLVRYPDGAEEALFSGEVTVRPAP